MSGYPVIPLASYSLEVIPGEPVTPFDEDVGVRITHATIEPNSLDDEEKPTTLRIIRRVLDADDDDFDYDEEDFDDEDDEEDDEEEDDDEEEMTEEEIKAAIKKAGKLLKEEEEEDEEEGEDDDEDMEEDSEEDDEEDSEDDEDMYVITEHPVCTLGPKIAYQVPLDLVLLPGEEIVFSAEGSYSVHLHGNYIEHPYDEEDSDEEDYDDYDIGDSDEDELDSDEYDLSPDEDEVIDGSERIEELEELEEDDEEEEEAPKPKTKKEKKKAIEEAKAEKKRSAAEAEEPKQSKKAKKEEKKVEFSKELEKGPSKKPVSRKVEGGVAIEDRTVGEGPVAKAGQKVGVRYIGKLANGKVFDSNTKGKPFYFALGKGEVIKGWDVGVAGMAVKGERRIVIPANMAYGKKALPGIPANSELTFDVKLVSIK